jgi:hypothetical protein
MNKNEIWEEIKKDKTIIYNQSMLDIFLQTTNALELDHYLELNDKQKKLISIGLAYKLAEELYERTKQRSSDLEKIIIEDPEYAMDYARDIIQGRWKEAEPIIMKDPGYAYRYARDAINDYSTADVGVPEWRIKKRWTEAEPYIMKEPIYAYSYAKHIIKKRWPEAEPFIMEDPHTWHLYKTEFKL